MVACSFQQAVHNSLSHSRRLKRLRQDDVYPLVIELAKDSEQSSCNFLVCIPASDIFHIVGSDTKYGRQLPSGSSNAASSIQTKTPEKVKTVTVNARTVSSKTIRSAVLRAGGSGKYVKKIILGKKVKKIRKNAFKSLRKVRTIEVRTRKLTGKSVKNSLKGSKIKTVKVRVGSKKLNKKYAKKYKKIFRKKNSGKKVKVI